MIRARVAPVALLLALSAALGLTLVSGCAATTTDRNLDSGGGGGGGVSGGVADATNGLTLSMFVESDGHRFELYRVEPSGILRFAGGIAARTENFSWSGPLEPGEIDRLRAIVADQGWFDRDPSSVAEPPGRLYRVQVRDRAHRASFIVRGDSPAVRPAYDVLRQAALRRNDEFLRNLPQPGQQD